MFAIIVIIHIPREISVIFSLGKNKHIHQSVSPLSQLRTQRSMIEEFIAP